jgi:hypothetical protein
MTAGRFRPALHGSERLPAIVVRGGPAVERSPVGAESTSPRVDRRADVRYTLAGLGMSLLLATAMALGSSAATLAASVVALAASVLSPMTGMVVLAFMAPLPRPLVVPTPGLHVVMLAAMLLGTILRMPIDRPRLRAPSPPVVAALLFLAYTTVQYVGGLVDKTSPRELEISSLYSQVLTGLLGFAIATVVLRARSPIPILAAALAAAVLQSLLALSQWIGVDGPFGGLIGEMIPGYRASGSFGDPNYMGSFLAAATTLAVACAILARSERMRVVLSASAVFIFVGVAVSMSRGALLAIVAGIITLAFLRNRRAGILVAGAALVIATVVYPAFADWRFGSAAEDATLGLSARADSSGRITAFLASQDLIASSPLIGIGFGRFVEESSTGDAAHNWYANVLAEMGLVGGVLWAAFIVALLLALRRRPRPAQVVGYPVLAAWMVASFFLELPMDYQSSGLVLITLAAALASDWSTPFVGHPEASGRPLGAGFPAASPASPRPARRLESG